LVKKERERQERERERERESRLTSFAVTLLFGLYANSPLISVAASGPAAEK